MRGTSALLKKLICYFALLALMSQAAAASPEPSGFTCTLKLCLSMDSIFAAPFDKRTEELAELIVPKIEYCEWPEGESLSISVDSDRKYAFSVLLIQSGGKIALSSDLMGDGQVLLSGDQQIDAQNLIKTVKETLSPDSDWQMSDCSFTLNAGRGAAHLSYLASTLWRWACAADAAHKEIMEASALFFANVSDIVIDSPSAKPLLFTIVKYELPELVPIKIDEGAKPAPHSLLAALTYSMPEAIIKAALCEGNEPVAD